MPKLSQLPPQICYIIIGAPGSGKSTIARQMKRQYPHYQIVSTDRIRAGLFGNEMVQGHWAEIEPEIFLQIQTAFTENYSIIYDATNAERPNRIQLLNQLNLEYPEIYWVGLQIQATLQQCKDRNLKRDRHVPEAIIERMAEQLRQFPPTETEGFAKIYTLWQTTDLQTQDSFGKIQPKNEDWIFKAPQADHANWLIMDDNKIDLSKVSSANIRRSLINRRNRIQKCSMHRYSKLIDFERLMHLIALIINHPGLGNLSEVNPKYLKEILDLDQCPTFDDSVTEICAVMTHYRRSSLYSDPGQITTDLSFLDQYGLTQVQPDLTKQIIPNFSGNRENLYLYCHSYSDRDVFERVLKTLHLLAWHPLDKKTEVEESELSNETKSKPHSNNISKQRQKDPSMRSLLAHKLVEQGVFLNHDPKNHKIIDDVLRKDIELVFKPYRIFPGVPMKRTYHLGSGLLNETEIKQLYKILSSQAHHLQDSNDSDFFQNFKSRLQTMNILSAKEQQDFYPVRGIVNRSIIAINQDYMERLETAIAKGQSLMLTRKSSKSSARFPEDPLPNQEFKIWPIQLVFHNIGWYLGFETELPTTGNKPISFYRFERLDRISSLITTPDEPRSLTKRKSALSQLTKLREAGLGIFLGNKPEEQQLFLSNETKAKEEIMRTFEMWCSKSIFIFIAEASRRLSQSAMRMSKVPNSSISKLNRNIYKLNDTGDQNYPYRFQLDLPYWALFDIDFIRWIRGFGNEIKVVEPSEIVKDMECFAQSLTDLYLPNFDD